ncbi:MAG: non-homologous end-joining DNA ligase [Acidimicrobiia bacterium]
MTKGEVAEYYHRVAKVMLPHLIDRPLTIQRFPQGIDKQGFMQKHAGKGFPDYIERIELAKQDGTVNYPVIRDEKGLAYLANQNTITFHIPGFRASHLEHPDRMVFDLDPSEGDLEGVRFAARATAELLAALDVPTWLMTSGSKGFHLVTPLQPTISFDEMSRFAQAAATLLARSHDEEMTVEFLKKERKGRVFVDWMRNHFGPTAVCPYSLRPRPGASIAMPIDWNALDTTEPDGFRLRRFDLADDPWAEAAPLDLTPAVAAVEDLIAQSGVDLPEFDRFGRT